ncbi:PREDICTED: ADP-ribosylation factor-binding protein GGA3 isoform X2 [Chrysochloris asiatica]|uniref:ADP-ribosylation factor-binding protein GGA3 isoform X2 n=1 Tax=Chrysochloris asiatica TaxID=185453 RepID=A0A9B0TXL7_CHRAS|nr:PREDICTED: ADP-ribosylation factor-binding protein GGA3 isoform X2 [Chrysochloris asiatica]
MAEAEGESLESWLNKATNPCNRQEDWEYIIGFCDQINKELEGPQIAVRLLAHKIQSPQEWEAVQALTYLGDRVSEKVKTKVIELLYSWTLALPEESKIKDAYHMLKRQGIVHSDPQIPADRTLIPSPPPRPKNPVFDDEEKSKLLAKLLKSKNPDDLQEANKLIKSMVKEDEARIQKVTKRMHTLEEVSNNVKLLHEMLLHYSKEDSSEADKELMQELFDRCENKRRTLFKLASETEDNDNSLGDILQASDNLSRVINSYKAIIEGQITNGEVSTSASLDPEGNHPCSSQGTLIDLAESDTPSSSSPVLAPAPPTSGIPILPPPPQTAGPLRSRSSSQAEASPGPCSSSSALSLLDEELLCLGLTDPPPSAPPKDTAGTSQWHLFQNEQPELGFFSPKLGPAASCSTDSPPLPPPAAPPTSSSPGPLFPAPVVPASAHAPTPSSLFPTGLATALGPRVQLAAPSYHGSALGDNALHQLDALDPLLEAKVASGLMKPAASSFFCAAGPAPLLPATASARPLFSFPAGSGSPPKGPEVSLASVHVPLESIKPSSALPVTAYDKNGFRILFHFAKECPPGRPDVLVVVVSMLNTAPLPIRSIVLQAAVPKSMKVKLQPPSGTELSPFSPIQPPAAITQVMLLANPLKEKVRLRYRLTFTLGEQQSTEVGEVDQFPPVEQWGSL